MTGFFTRQLTGKIILQKPSGHPEGLDLNFTRQMTGKTRHLGVFSRQNRVFSRHKQMSRGQILNRGLEQLFEITCSSISAAVCWVVYTQPRFLSNPNLFPLLTIILPPHSLRAKN